MKKLLFYTKDYCKQLESIGFIAERGKLSDYSLFTINGDELDFEKLSAELKKIIFESNPLTRNSIKIRGLIDENLFSSFAQNVSSDIINLLTESEFVNIDGYICFHLNKYKEIIDNTLYLLVKRYLNP
ncbi:MAG: hypothetical protein LBV08_02635 [Clostridiales bacterium]|nr:hypothetical protein [Clostridiales bacterium]